MPKRPDMDEPISLYPLTGEEALRRLLGADDEDITDPSTSEDDEP